MTTYRTPRIHERHEIVECAECGHLHFDQTCLAYVVCPLGLEGCDCVGQTDTPYLAEPVPTDPEVIRLGANRETARALQRAVRGQQPHKDDAGSLRWNARLSDGRRVVITVEVVR